MLDLQQSTPLALQIRCVCLHCTDTSIAENISSMGCSKRNPTPVTFSNSQELLVGYRQVQIEIAEPKPLTGNRGALQSDETAFGDLGVRQHSFLLAAQINLNPLAGKVDF